MIKLRRKSAADDVGRSATNWISSHSAHARQRHWIKSILGLPQVIADNVLLKATNLSWSNSTSIIVDWTKTSLSISATRFTSHPKNASLAQQTALTTVVHHGSYAQQRVSRSAVSFLAMSSWNLPALWPSLRMVVTCFSVVVSVIARAIAFVRASRQREIFRVYHRQKKATTSFTATVREKESKVQHVVLQLSNLDPLATISLQCVHVYPHINIRRMRSWRHTKLKALYWRCIVHGTDSSLAMTSKTLKLPFANPKHR